MSEFTTIQITKEVRQKLDLCKGTNNLTYNQIVERLLEQSGGTIVEDTIEIQREQVALTLNYWDKNRTILHDITYNALKDAGVGNKFTANDEIPVDVNEFMNSTAEVLVSNDVEVVLAVEEVNYRKGKVSSIRSLVHIVLF